MISFRDRAYCSSEVETHTCGREFTKKDAIDAEEWWGNKEYPVAYGKFCETDRLLSDEELVAEIWSGVVKHDSLAGNNIGYPTEQTSKKLIDLINTQKRLYAESVIGEDSIPQGFTFGKTRAEARVENALRTEQRARIK